MAKEKEIVEEPFDDEAYHRQLDKEKEERQKKQK